MVSVLISVVSNTESTHGQSAEESRKAAFTLFKKLKVCAYTSSRSEFHFENKYTKNFNHFKGIQVWYSGKKVKLKLGRYLNWNKPPVK